VVYTQRNLIHTKKNKILSFLNKWIELEKITLSKVSQAQKRPDIACFYSYVDYRLKTNAVILLDMGHTQRREQAREE
jgi:hypothetical protein